MLPGLSPGLTALTALGMLLGVAIPFAMTLAVGHLIGSVPPALGTGTGSSAAHTLRTAFVIVAALYVAQQTVLPLLSLVTSQLSRRFGEHLALRAMRCVGDSPSTGHLEDPDTLRKIEEATGRATGMMPGAAIVTMSQLWTGRLSALASAGLLFSYHWWVALPLLVAAPLLMRFWRGYYEKTTATLFGQNQELRRTTYLQTLLMGRAGAAEVRVFGLMPHLLSRSERNWRATMDVVFASWRGDRWRVILAVVGGAGINLAALALIAHDGATHAISLASVSILVSAVFGLSALGALDDDAYTISLMLASLPSLLELETLVAAARPVGSLAVAPDLPRQGIRFEDVSFTYPGRTTPVYDGLNLFLEAGHSTAIVGVNGAGKTTLVKLLARMRAPDSGRITVDGIDLSEIEPVAWQRRVAAIFQTFMRYELSAYDNIALGAPERQHDQEGVRRAAARAGIADVIEALPRGWQTPLSRQLDGGADLSGGEWQRLALARALFAVGGADDAGAGVLVLDEPTASLDVRTEADLFDRFLDLTHGLTTVVISHRFSTVRRADRIVVLDAGRVVEQGSHDELVASGGRYAELFSLQAARYLDLAEEASADA